MSDVTLQLRELREGTPEYEAAAEWDAAHGLGKVDPAGIDPSALPRARSLRYWVQNWGGYSTEMSTPDGSKHVVSLDEWRGRDLDSTFVEIRFIYRNPNLIGTRRPR